MAGLDGALVVFAREFKCKDMSLVDVVGGGAVAAPEDAAGGGPVDGGRGAGWSGGGPVGGAVGSSSNSDDRSPEENLGDLFIGYLFSRVDLPSLEGCNIGFEGFFEVEERNFGGFLCTVSGEICRINCELLKSENQVSMGILALVEEFETHLKKFK